MFGNEEINCFQLLHQMS